MKTLALMFCMLAFSTAVLRIVFTFRFQVANRNDDAALKQRALMGKVICSPVFVAFMSGFSVCLANISMLQYGIILEGLGTAALGALTAFAVSLAIGLFTIMKKKENVLLLSIMNGVPFCWNMAQFLGLGWAVMKIVSLFF